MGQKVNPIGFRLGINRGWDSVWFARKGDYGKYLIEDYKIREYIKKNIQNSGVSEIIIERSGKKCSVFIHTSRPGFVIGKKGSDIEKIKKNDSFFIYHAGTEEKDNKVYANGGRVLNFVSISDNFKSSRDIVIKEIENLNWDSGFYR